MIMQENKFSSIWLRMITLYSRVMIEM